MAETVGVLCSGAFIEPFRWLAPLLERRTGCALDVAQGPSVGDGPNAIPTRLRREASCDLAIVFEDAMDALAAEGVIRPGARRIAASSIAAAARAGCPTPDIGSVDALRRTLLEAESIAVSASASGAYLLGELFPRLRIADAVSGKCVRVVNERVAAVLARGAAEIGFQQLSELTGADGVVILGELPPEVQRVTVLSAGVPARSAKPGAARAMIDLLLSEEARQVVSRSGLRPM